MNPTRTRVAILAPVIAMLFAACGASSGGAPPASDGPTAAGAVSPAPVAIPDPPITLRLAIAGAAGPPGQAVIDDLVQRVATLSGGKITIVPTYDAAGPRFEEGVVELLQDGDADLAIAASRAWDLHGETGLQALQAPFLIDNDALVVAVAGGEVARQALDGMDSAVGLTLWPEDLRHPVSFGRCGKDFSSPAGLVGATFLVQPSELANRVLDQLGATRYPTQGVDRNIDAAACTLHGMEAGMLNLNVVPMDAAPVMMADLTLFPKFQVLAANADAFNRLSEPQQAVLLAAAEAVGAAALEGHRVDPELAAGWCAKGGTLALAGADAQAAYRAAVEPVYAELSKDSETKGLIEAIATLKAATPASPLAAPCDATTLATPVPVDAIDTTGYVGTTFPNGTFRREIVAEDLVAAGLDPELAKRNEQVLTYIFDDGKVTFRWESARESGGCEGTYQSRDDKLVEMVTTGGDADCGVGPNSVWREEPDGISFISLDPSFLPSDHILVDRWVWTRIK